MADSIEGRTASYVGPDTVDGLRTGDRCRVLSDERSIIHVRWTTGALTDCYGEVTPREIVPDLNVMARYEDEFGFEAGRGRGGMGIDVTAVYDRGGEIALFSAMESEGQLDTLKVAARKVVDELRRVVAMDPSWDGIRTSLGDQAHEVISSAIIAAITVASDEDDEVSTDWEEGDEIDDFLE